jgi:hypothetical protein
MTGRSFVSITYQRHAALISGLALSVAYVTNL